ncbi:hypothetical protein [Rhodococcus ruber]|uniref:hypothetical protein n=1 Tax=Rhodococcus ruber TaxID=1830 RepID=UPI00126863E1|nr:hypothetical protein [Rhodococcus ruber]
MPWFQVLQVVTVTIVAVVGLPAALHQNYSPRLRLEHQIKRLIDILDKTPEGTPGREQMQNDLKVSTFKLAFLIQYPKTFRDRVPTILVLIQFLTIAIQLIWLTHNDFGPVSVALYCVQYGILIPLYMSIRNSTEAEILIRRLFVTLNAPTRLAYPRPPVFRRQQQVGIGDVLEFAAYARDRTADLEGRSMTSIEAINAGIFEATNRLSELNRKLRAMRIQTMRLKWMIFWRRIAGSVLMGVATIMYYLVIIRHPSKAKQIRGAHREFKAAQNSARKEIDRKYHLANR